MTLLSFSHCSEAVRHFCERYWTVSWNSQQENCSPGMLGTEHICPAALMRKWTGTQGCASQPRLWAALLPFTGHGLSPLGSSQNSQNYFTEMLFIFNNCLVRVTNFKSLLYTGLYNVFGVHTALLCTFFPQQEQTLSVWGAFTLGGCLSVCMAGFLSLAPVTAVWSEQGRVVGAARQQQLRGSSHTTTTFYTSHLFEMPTIRRIKSVLHASQQQ